MVRGVRSVFPFIFHIFCSPFAHTTGNVERKGKRKERNVEEHERRRWKGRESGSPTQSVIMLLAANCLQGQCLSTAPSVCSDL